MKFTKKQIRDVQLKIQNTGYLKTSFSFIKRRGRVLIRHNASDSSFSFYRNRAKPHQQAFLPISYEWFYEVRKTNGPIIIQQSWDDVLAELNKWLLDLKTPDQIDNSSLEKGSS